MIVLWRNVCAHPTPKHELAYGDSGLHKPGPESASSARPKTFGVYLTGASKRAFVSSAEPQVTAEGLVLVSRVELAKSPASCVPHSLDYTWMLEDEEVLRIDLSRPSADHVTVEVVGVVWQIADPWQFAGKIDGSSLPGVSVTTQAISRNIDVCENPMVEFQSGDVSDSNSSHTVPSLLAFKTLVFAIGIRASHLLTLKRRPSHTRRWRRFWPPDSRPLYGSRSEDESHP